MKHLRNLSLICCLVLSACNGEPVDFTAEVVNSSTLDSVTADQLILRASIVQYNDREEADVEVVILDDASKDQIRFDQGEIIEAGAGSDLANDDSEVDYVALDEDYEFYDPIFSIFYEANVGGKIAKASNVDEVYFIRYTDKDENSTFTVMSRGSVSDILTPAANAELSGDSVEITWNPEETLGDVYLYIKWEDEEGEQAQLLDTENTGSYELDISEMDGSGSIQLRTLDSFQSNDPGFDFDEIDLRLTSIAELAIADFHAD